MYNQTDTLDRPSAVLPTVVEAELNFTERTAEKPFTYAYARSDGGPQTNIQTTGRRVRIHNARLAVGALDLDVEGFRITGHRSAVSDFWDEAQVLALGHPETAELVRKVTGARRVVVFDHTLRRRVEGVLDRTAGAARQPAVRVHVDQTIASGPQRVREIMGEEADALLAGRAAIINVWRPIHHAARDWPLAFADARSIAPEDLIASDLIFPHRRGEIYGLAYNPDQRWRYVPDLTPDEAVLIKCWDSDPRVARFTPHTAFADPTTPPDTPPRQSIEFRTMAFWG
jgi:hypothetical protein